MPKILSKNKKAYYDYDILDRFEAGVILDGWEVKSIKAGLANIKSSFVVFKKGEIFVVGMHVPRWKTQSRSEVIDETREKKLLLNKKELEKLQVLMKGQGATVIVLQIYLKGRMIKFEIGVGKGKKKYDKREAKKKKDMKREIKSKGIRW